MLYPEILTNDYKLAITDNGGGTITINIGQELKVNTVRINTDDYVNVVDQSDSRKFTHLASNTYHLRFSLNKTLTNDYEPVDYQSFYLIDVSDTDYNPAGAYIENDPVFDTVEDDILIARIVTDGSNVPTITKIPCKQMDSYQTGRYSPSVRFTHLENLSGLEQRSSQMRVICPSGWLPPHNKVGYVEENNFSDSSSRNSVVSSLITRLHSNITTDDSNKLYILNSPSKVCVNGHTIVLESKPSKYSNLTVELPTVPSTGTRQDLVFLEVWKEEVQSGILDDVFFPYGNVGYDPYNDETTYDSCTLVSTSQSVGNWPLYLAGMYGNPSIDSSYHGKYVLVNDTNIETFIKNSDNNVGVTEGGKFYQIRWRIATLSAHTADYFNQTAFNNGTDYFIPQGQKVSRSVVGVITNTNGILMVQSGINTSGSTKLDSGMFLGGTYTDTDTKLTSISNLSLDGFTYNIPICIVHRRNLTAWALDNINGADVIISDLVTNGDFTTDSDWTKGTGWTISGTAVHDTGTASDLSQDVSMVSGKKYKITYEISNMSVGSLTPKCGTVAGIIKTGNKIYTDYIISDGATLTFSATSDFNGLIDNVSVLLETDRPDNLYYDEINEGDILDLRHRVSPNGFNVKELHEEFFQQLLKSDLKTNWEQFKSDQNGDETFDDTDIYGTKLTRIEGVNGNDLTTDFPTGDIVQQTTCNNTISAKFDGLRNYYSDQPGEQAILGKIVNESINERSGIVKYDSIHKSIVLDPDNIMPSWISGSDSLKNGNSSIIKDGSTYKMWYNGDDGNNQRIHYATSDDGITWIKQGSVLSAGVEGESDESTVVQPSVIKDGSTYKMWYSGYDGNNQRIHYATSDDGITWIKHVSTSGLSDPHWVDLDGTPVVVPLGAEGESDDKHTYTPTVKKEGPTDYKMWYAGNNGSYPVIHYAISDDGITWIKHNGGNTPVVPRGVEGESDDTRNYNPSVIKDGSTYKMWYSGYDYNNWRILYCTSDDCITWTKYSRTDHLNDPILGDLNGTPVVVPLGAEGESDDKNTYTPSVIKDGSTYKMWYSGHDITTQRIHYATSTDGITWVKHNGGDTPVVPLDIANDDRPQFSGRKPDVYWFDDVNNTSYVGKGCKASVYWDALSGDLLTGTIRQETGDELIGTLISGTLVEGETFTIDGVTCFIKSWNAATTTNVRCIFTGIDIPSATGEYSSSSATFDITSHNIGYSVIDYDNTYVTDETSLNSSYLGEGYDLHTTKGLSITSYIYFKAGSGFLSRVPYDDHISDYNGLDSIKASEFYIEGSQVIPNNGIGWHPFGTKTNDDDNGSTPDTHTKSTGLVGFIKRGPVVGLDNDEINHYDSGKVSYPTVIKDESIYKMWYVGHDDDSWRILYCESTDGVNWTNHKLAIDIDNDVTNHYDIMHSSYPCVIKVGDDYKMWYSGYDGYNWRILYCTSDDGVTWTNSTLAVDIGNLGSGVNNATLLSSCIIKVGDDYKMWYGGSTSGGIYRIFYCDSTDGIGDNWTNHKMVIVRNRDVGSPYDYRRPQYPRVIKEGSIYKMWYVGMDNPTVERIMYCISEDGINWAGYKMVMDRRTENYYDRSDINGHCVIYDDPVYKIWVTGRRSSDYQIFHGIFTMISGSMNFAPPVDSSVIIHYKSRAIQQDWSRLGGSDQNYTLSYNLKYLSNEGVVTSLGTGGRSGSNYPSDYRDFITNLLGNSIGYDLYSYNLKNSAIIDFSSKILNIGDDRVFGLIKYLFGNNPFLPSNGDFISLSSLEKVAEYFSDENYPAFKQSLQCEFSLEDGNGLFFVCGVGEKDRKLFGILTHAPAQEEATSLLITNLIGRPVIR